MKDEYDFSEARRGSPVTSGSGKTRITIRLDSDVLDWFRSEAHKQGGGNYQTMINQALREYVDTNREPIEDKLRRVVREELRRAAG